MYTFLIITTHTVFSKLCYQFLLLLLLPTVLPIITRHPENVHVVHNTNVILQCEAVGGSNITYKWTKDGAVLLSDNKGSLMLESVQESDEGAYQCVAMNSRGETATSKNAILVVYGKYIFLF